MSESHPQQTWTAATQYGSRATAAIDYVPEGVLRRGAAPASVSRPSMPLNLYARH